MRGSLLLLLVAVAFLGMLGWGLERAGLPLLIGAVVFFVALGFAFVRGAESLYLIVLSIMFSPEIGTGLGTGRATGEGAGGIVLRFEDLVLIAVGCGWLLRTAYQQRRFGVPKTPLNGPIAAYLIISLLATLLGVLAGRVRLVPGIVHNLKYFEYFFLFFMILAHVRERELIKRIIILSLAMFFFAALYGYPQIDLNGTGRVCAPFDTEPNTFGGYLVLMMCVAFGILQTATNLRMMALLIALLAIAMPPFLFTLSRASYLALTTAWLAFLAFSPRRLTILLATMGVAAAVLLALPLIPERVQNRVVGTFQRQREYHVQIAGVDLDSSASARIVSYKQALEVWQTSPLFGKGVTGTHFIDSQYFRLLAETGLLGLGAFLVILYRLALAIWQIYRRCDDPFLSGAAFGFFCSIFALMVHALSANTFIIVRISEAFWLFAGILLLVPQVSPSEGIGADESAPVT